jgi:hypothetical protein
VVRGDVWGRELGAAVNQIRTPDYFVRDSQERRQWLEEAGFRFETAESNNQAVNDEQWEKKVLPAITAYKQVHGDLQVPFSFAVPSSGEWEEGGAVGHAARGGSEGHTNEQYIRA